MNRPQLMVLVLLASTWAGAYSFAASSSKAGSCEVQCGQALSRCEHKLGPAGNCVRRLSNCNAECIGGKPHDARSSKLKKQALCEQRCDLNRTTCEEANPSAPQHCIAGQQSCIKRCN